MVNDHCPKTECTNITKGIRAMERCVYIRGIIEQINDVTYSTTHTQLLVNFTTRACVAIAMTIRINLPRQFKCPGDSRWEHSGASTVLWCGRS